MINYLRHHINVLPDHHETTEIRSDWEIRENEERLTRERDERTRERDEKQETINHKQRVIDWYKTHWNRPWFIDNCFCPFE